MSGASDSTSVGSITGIFECSGGGGGCSHHFVFAILRNNTSTKTEAFIFKAYSGAERKTYRGNARATVYEHLFGMKIPDKRKFKGCLNVGTSTKIGVWRISYDDDYNRTIDDIEEKLFPWANQRCHGFGASDNGDDEYVAYRATDGSGKFGIAISKHDKDDEWYGYEMSSVWGGSILFTGEALDNYA